MKADHTFLSTTQTERPNELRHEQSKKISNDQNYLKPYANNKDAFRCLDSIASIFAT